MSGERIHVSRWKVGLISLVLLAAGLVIRLYWPEKDLAQGACVRVGLLMAAIWLAMPGGDRRAAWSNISRTTLAGFLVLLVGVIRPKLFLPLAPILAVIAVLNYLGRLTEKERPATRPGDRRR